MPYDPERLTSILVLPPGPDAHGRTPQGGEPYSWMNAAQSTMIFILDDEIIEQFAKAYPAKKVSA